MIQALTPPSRSRATQEIRLYVPAVRLAAALATANQRAASDLRAARERGLSVPPALEARIAAEGRAIAAQTAKLDQVGAILREAVRVQVAAGQLDARNLPPELWGAPGGMRGLGALPLLAVGVAVVIVAGMTIAVVGSVLVLNIPSILEALNAAKDQSVRTAAEVDQYKAAVSAEIQQAAAQGRPIVLPPAPGPTPRVPSWLDRIAEGLARGAANTGTGIGTAFVVAAVAGAAWFIFTRTKTRSRK